MSNQADVTSTGLAGAANPSLRILHNKACSTSRFAVESAEEAGVDAEIRLYLKQPLTAEEVSDLLDQLEDEPTTLVRRDTFFRDAGLTDADVATREQVIETLVTHPRLMERPVLIRNGRAIIGRPKDRVAGFLNS